MTDLELIFTMLGEKVTTEISKKKNLILSIRIKRWQNVVVKLQESARKDTEKELGRSIVSKENFLAIEDKSRKMKKKK